MFSIFKKRGKPASFVIVPSKQDGSKTEYTLELKKSMTANDFATAVLSEHPEDSGKICYNLETYCEYRAGEILSFPPRDPAFSATDIGKCIVNSGYACGDGDMVDYYLFSTERIYRKDRWI